MLGVSTVSTFAESTAGVADGAKTGLASLVTGSCFLLAIPFSPVVSAAAWLPHTVEASVIANIMVPYSQNTYTVSYIPQIDLK